MGAAGSVLYGARRIVKNVLRDAVLNPVWASPILPTEARWLLLRFAGLDVKRSSIAFGGWLGSRRILIGKGVYINAHVFLDNSDWIRIGDLVSVGPRVQILTSTHEAGDRLRRAGRAVTHPVSIGAGTWIGAGSIILPGVSIGAGVVVAAGSVVSASCEANALYAGVPARLIRKFDDEERAPRP
jgi:maltose O-acetyltransferase